MNVRVGTSGFSYAAWKGAFYPPKIHGDEMLAFYASRFPTVEINNTFHRMPKTGLLESWRGQVPAGFVFALKAPQRITHKARLDESALDPTTYFLRVAGTLGDRLGPLLFQLPPYLRLDLPRLRAFLELLPAGTRAAFEFRHASWFTDEVYDALHAHAAALCVSEDEGREAPPLAATADWGYLRLRRPDYDEHALADWAARIAAKPWGEVFVYFKHEDEAKGPAYATAFTREFARVA